MDYAWTCQCCGKTHDSLPLDYAAEAPAHWFGLPGAERAARAVLTADFCTIDGVHHFVRGCVEIPIQGRGEHFTWGVWVSLSEASIRRAAELFETDPEPDEAPRFGWLGSTLPLYGTSTLNLKTLVHFRRRPLRPAVEVEAVDHLLSLEQRKGMPLRRVQEIAAALLHRGDTARSGLA